MNPQVRQFLGQLHETFVCLLAVKRELLSSFDTVILFSLNLPSHKEVYTAHRCIARQQVHRRRYSLQTPHFMELLNLCVSNDG
jgi:hypothetical protein